MAAAKLTLRAESSSFHLLRRTHFHTRTSLWLKRSHFHVFPSDSRLRSAISYSIKEKEKENVLGSERVSDSDGLRCKWKDVPQRYTLIGTTSLAFVICNMDKVNLSIAVIPMSHQFGWSSSTAGLVQSSFFWGYALSQLPGGWMAKIFGGRNVHAVGVLTWSLATALVPSLAGFMPGLLFSRFLVGIGEGVSPSAATDLIARHVNTVGRAFKGCGICFWWPECRKCCRVCDFT